MFAASALGILAVFFFFGILSSGKASSSSEYSVAGRKATAGGVSGIILGSLVGGSSTVGTVQMAYHYGLSAWWFTLGGGIGCLIMGLWFVKPLRATELITLPQFLGRHFGQGSAFLSAVTTALGSFIALIAQFLAGTALLGSVFPFPSWVSAVFMAVLILAFAYGGGIKSFSRLGKAKIIFLYGVMILCVGAAFLAGQTPSMLVRSLPADPFFNLFARGVARDLGAFTSLLCGVLCGQIYIQAVYAASSDATARKGCLLAFMITPPLGLLGVWIGLALRNSGVPVEASQALPFFIRTYFHPVVAGLLWSGIMITVLGTSVGITFGVATNLTRDMYLKTKRAAAYDDAKILFASRITVLGTVTAAGLIALAAGKSMILQWAYLGMGIKGAGIIIPLIAAVFLPGRLPAVWSLLSGTCGLAGVFIGAAFFKDTDPLLPGLALSGLAALAGLLAGRRQTGLPER
ncbi:MAG: solute:Na+ symporter, family [Synergistaceae bacterium]|nr:solute:Na+ symporter, family [Synergistaceae bacterium]